MVSNIPNSDGTNTMRSGRLLPHISSPLHAAHRRHLPGAKRQQQRRPRDDGDVPPDVRHGVVQTQGRGVGTGRARQAAGRLPLARRRRLARPPRSSPPGSPLLRRSPRRVQKMMSRWRSPANLRVQRSSLCSFFFFFVCLIQFVYCQGSDCTRIVGSQSVHPVFVFQ